MPKVFICYSSKDHVFAHKLTVGLRRKDIDVWIDEIGLKIGDSLIKNIGEAIVASDYLLAIISNNSVESEWVNRELRLALSMEFAENKTKVLPIIIDRCKMPPFLLDKMYADFTNSGSFDYAIDKLCETINPQDNFTVFDDIVIGGNVINPILELHKIADEMGFGSLSLDKKQELFLKMTEVVMKRIFLETMMALDDEARERYEALIDGDPDPNEVDTFLRKHIDDYDGLVANIISEFKAEMAQANA